MDEKEIKQLLDETVRTSGYEWPVHPDREEKMRRLATYGTTADIWRVDAHFSHIDGPVTYETDAGKEDAYRYVANWLMSANIQRILVYVNGKLYQSITVNASTD